jgi:hypothetical protein
VRAVCAVHHGGLHQTTMRCDAMARPETGGRGCVRRRDSERGSARIATSTASGPNNAVGAVLRCCSALADDNGNDVFAIPRSAHGGRGGRGQAEAASGSRRGAQRVTASVSLAPLLEGFAAGMQAGASSRGELRGASGLPAVCGVRQRGRGLPVPASPQRSSSPGRCAARSRSAPSCSWCQMHERKCDSYARGGARSGGSARTRASVLAASGRARYSLARNWRRKTQAAASE